MDDRLFRLGDHGRYPASSHSHTKWIEILLTIAELWSQLLHSFPVEERSFALPPATEKQIRQLEQEIGSEIPKGLRDLLQITNGTSRDVSRDFHLYPTLLSIEQILIAHRQNLDEIDLNGTIENMEFSYKWIPGVLLIADEDGAGFVVELSNEQVWSWDHDGWYFTKKADTIRDLLEKTVVDREFWCL